jgi:transaldolase
LWRDGNIFISVANSIGGTDMGIFLDSANIEEAKTAFGMGFVRGVTTNPKLMSLSKREPFDVLKDLCAVSPGPVFYQLTAATPKERDEEAHPD